jgi:hypothetical protein
MYEKTEQEREKDIRDKYRQINNRDLLVETLVHEFESDMNLFYRVCDKMLGRLTKIGKQELARDLTNLDQWP